MSVPNLTEALGDPGLGPEEPTFGAPPETKVDWAKLSAAGKRERLLSAADSLFVESGLDASMPAIAERAAASVGSMYRQFPSKLDLIEAIVARRFALIERVAAEATMSDGPAWPELVGMVWTVVARQVAAAYFADAWHQVAERTPVLDARLRARNEFARLVDRCQAEGSIRADASADDLWLIFIAARGASQYESANWRRTVNLMLDGLRA
jgi:AcrR family transcriptional regulator